MSKVIARLVPLSENAPLHCPSTTLRVVDEDSRLALEFVDGNNNNNTKKFYFDAVVPVHAHNHDLFQTHLTSVVNELIDEGQSTSVVVFGGKNCGKSVTVFGNMTQSGVLQPIVQQLLRDVAKISNSQSSKKQPCVAMTFYEIVNEQLFDLLDTANKSIKLVQKKGVSRVSKATKLKLASWAQTHSILTTALQKRASSGGSYGSAAMTTPASAHSHIGTAVLELILDPQSRSSRTVGTPPKISLIDLSADLNDLSCIDLAALAMQRKAVVPSTQAPQPKTILGSLLCTGFADERTAKANKHNVLCIAMLRPFPLSLEVTRSTLEFASVLSKACPHRNSTATLPQTLKTHLASLPLPSSGHQLIHPQDHNGTSPAPTPLLTQHTVNTTSSSCNADSSANRDHAARFSSDNEDTSDGADDLIARLIHYNHTANALIQEQSRILGELASARADAKTQGVILRRLVLDKRSNPAASVATSIKSQEAVVEAAKARVHALQISLRDLEVRLARLRNTMLKQQSCTFNPHTLTHVFKNGPTDYVHFLERELLEAQKQVAVRDRVLGDFVRAASQANVSLNLDPALAVVMTDRVVLPQNLSGHLENVQSMLTSAKITAKNSDLTSSPDISKRSNITTEEAHQALAELAHKKSVRRSLRGSDPSIVARAFLSEDSNSATLVSKHVAPQDEKHFSTTTNATAAEPIPDVDTLITPATTAATMASGVFRPKSWNAPPYAVVRRVETLSELYTVTEELGRGGFATVSRGVEKATGKEYALKIVRNNVFRKNQRYIETEVHIVSGFTHPQLVQLKEVVRTPEHFVMVLDLVPLGELFNKILEVHTFEEHVVRDVVHQLLAGLEVLHAHGVVHRDVKPENILIDSYEGSYMNIKLTDFGLSVCTDEDGNSPASVAGTPEYSAPEILRKQAYSFACDMWSIGVVVYIMLCGFPPFYGDSTAEVAARVRVGKFKFPKQHWSNISADAKDFVSKLLEVDQSKRMTIEEARRHRWMCTAPFRMKHAAEAQNTSQEVIATSATKFRESPLFKRRGTSPPMQPKLAKFNEDEQSCTPLTAAVPTPSPPLPHAIAQRDGSFNSTASSNASWNPRKSTGEAPSSPAIWFSRFLPKVAS